MQPPRTFEQMTKNRLVSTGQARADDAVPPGGPAGDGVGRGGELVAGQGVADDDHVGLVGVERAPGLVGDLDVFERAAAIQLEGLAGVATDRRFSPSAPLRVRAGAFMAADLDQVGRRNEAIRGNHRAGLGCRLARERALDTGFELKGKLGYQVSCAGERDRVSRVRWPLTASTRLPKQ